MEVVTRIRGAGGTAVVLAGFLLGVVTVPAAAQEDGSTAGAEETEDAPESKPRAIRTTPRQSQASQAELEQGKLVRKRGEKLWELGKAASILCDSPKDPGLEIQNLDVVPNDDSSLDFLVYEQRRRLCTEWCGSKAILDLCSLKDLKVAEVVGAADADWSDVEGIVEKLGEPLGAPGRPGEPWLLLDGLDTKVKPGETSPFVAYGKALRGLQLSRQVGGPGEASLIEGLNLPDGQVFFTRLFEGIAKFVLDRARQEAVAWGLENVSTNLCEGTGTGVERRAIHLELSGHWFPRLCQLAEADRLSGYGAGGRMLESLRGVVEKDVRRLPAVPVGIATGTLALQGSRQLAREAPSNIPEYLDDRFDEATILTCAAEEVEGGPARSIECEAVEVVRRATEEAMIEIIEGEPPLVRLAELAEDIDEANRGHFGANLEKDTERETRMELGYGYLHGAELQGLACVTALPAAMKELPPASFGTGDKALTAALVTALVRTDSCWALVGEGIEIDAAGKLTCETRLALDEPFRVGHVERLSTALRLYKLAAGHTDRVGRRWERLEQAKTDLAAVDDRVGRDLKELGPPHAVDPSKPETVTALETWLDAHAHLMLDLFDAQMELVDAALELGQAGLVVLQEDWGQAVPGACVHREDDGKCVPPELAFDLTPLPDHAAQAEEALECVEEHVELVGEVGELVRAALDRRWAVAIGGSMSLFRSGKIGICGEDANCQEAIDGVSRAGTFLVAIMSAENGDEIAMALEGVVNPPGGWRDKQRPGTVTLSLTAHAGVGFTGEARWGPYGAVYERGGFYAMAPTLVMPIGLELAVAGDCQKAVRNGHRSCGFPSPLAFFVSLIDPAAFLSYDSSKVGQGRLPGPRPLTVLDLGGAIRFGFGGSPFGAMFHLHWRPQFRTWEPTVNGPGADVLQFTAAVTVDVTMLRTRIPRHRRGR